MRMQWLLAKAPGFQALPGADLSAIFNFTFLWSLLEGQVIGNFARADLGRECWFPRRTEPVRRIISIEN